MGRTGGELLAMLTAIARVSFSDLGCEVGLKPNEVAPRTRRLDNDGVIMGYTATLAGDAQHPVDSSTDVETASQRLAAFREVADTAHIPGPFDALVHVFVPD